MSRCLDVRCNAADERVQIVQTGLRLITLMQTNIRHIKISQFNIITFYHHLTTVYAYVASIH